jgi:hypothetical protein
MQLTKWIPLQKSKKIEYEINRKAILPRYSANNDCYPVLDSLYKTIKSNSLVKSGNQYKTIDFEDEKTASQPISEIMACIIFSLLT